ncbi:uncharacterized protein FOMMEDRAFT_160390 [Fomitiporia mediterranea MF3/22]|uniref:uncharacterized protein n=1 Tax=Fomitiporia mediterranea (strain MF3/22) TaxID=694068 RepID=UPI0004407783|nr:uncharacterized protein FOMMEDRAFT_160390 [Fomitiporia mediterranea MF3/22]EJC99914.1 hypothetical protein FOMMEDRAFT_160390 [Fomitiporia mediterranea MF3/22]
MTSHDKRMDEWTTGCPQSRATVATQFASRDIEYCMQMLHAMDGEKACYGERMQASRHLAHIYGGLGDVKNFKKWSFMTAWILRLGGSPMYLIWEFWYANPSAFALWKTVADLKETTPQGKDTSYTV